MSEHNLWVQCRDIIAASGGHASRIESHDTVNGFPDVDFCVHGTEYKMELKFTDADNMPDIRASQVRWFSKRIKAGSNPFFLIKIQGRSNWYAFVKGKRAYDLAHLKKTTELLSFDGTRIVTDLNYETFWYGVDYATEITD